MFYLLQNLYINQHLKLYPVGTKQFKPNANIASQFGLQISSGQQEQTFVYTDIIKSKIIAGKILERRFSTKEFGQNKTLLQIIT